MIGVVRPIDSGARLHATVTGSSTLCGVVFEHAESVLTRPVDCPDCVDYINQVRHIPVSSKPTRAKCVRFNHVSG